jgi:hypothetical protein
VWLLCRRGCLQPQPPRGCPGGNLFATVEPGVCALLRQGSLSTYFSFSAPARLRLRERLHQCQYKAQGCHALPWARRERVLLRSSPPTAPSRSSGAAVAPPRLGGCVAAVAATPSRQRLGNCVSIETKTVIMNVVLQRQRHLQHAASSSPARRHARAAVEGQSPLTSFLDYKYKFGAGTLEGIEQERLLAETDDAAVVKPENVAHCMTEYTKMMSCSTRLYAVCATSAYDNTTISPTRRRMCRCV